MNFRIFKLDLIKNFSIYTILDLLNKGIPFFLLPIFTKYLSPSDYGMISVITSFVGIIALIIGLNAHSIISVDYFKYSTEKFRRLIFNLFNILLFTTIICFFILLFTSDFIFKSFDISVTWVFVILIIACSQFINNILGTLLIAKSKAKVFGLFQISQTALQALIALLLIVGIGMNWEGRVIAITLSSIILSFYTIYYLNKNDYFSKSFDKEIIGDTLNYSIPLIPHSISIWIRNSLDSLLIMFILGSSLTGIYSLGYQIGTIITIVITSFNKAWIPFFMKRLNTSLSYSEKRKLVSYTYIYFIAIIGIVLIFIYLIPYLFKYFIDEKFTESISVTILIVISYGVTGFYFMVGNYLFFTKKTKELSYVSIFIATFHALLSYILIHINGMIGAAQATIISNTLNFLLVWYLSNKYYPMPWNIFKYYKGEKYEKEN